MGLNSSVLAAGNEVNVELAIAAIALCPTLEDASGYLKEQHGIQASPEKLAVMKRHHPERLEKAREQAAPHLEGVLANDMLDNASLATRVENVAIQRTLVMLEEGKMQDPSKVARDLADVKAKSVDKRLALQGRPTQITEHRSVDENWAALERMGVLVVDATSEPDDAELVEPHESD